MNKKLIIPLLFCAIVNASQEDIQKRDEEVLNVVTKIKPLHRLIRDYLDLPDQLVHTLKLPSSRDEFACSESHIAIQPYMSKEIFIRNILTGALITSVPLNKKESYEFVFSPNGQYIAHQGQVNHDIDIYDVNTKKLIHTIPENIDTANRSFKFSSDSSQLVHAGFVLSDKEFFADKKFFNVIIIDSQTGRQVNAYKKIIIPPATAGIDVGISHNCNYAYVCLANGQNCTSQVHILDILSGGLKTLIIDMGRIHWAPLVSDNGKYLLIDSSLYDITNSENVTAVIKNYPVLLNFGHTQKYLITNENKKTETKTDNAWSIYSLPVRSHGLIFLKNGAYMVTSYANNAGGITIEVLKNQAHDLDCQEPKTTVIDHDESNSSGCMIA